MYNTKTNSIMPSTSETGHAKNVVNFETLITTVTSLGTTYNPSKALLKTTALTSQLNKAKTEISNVSTKFVAYNTATNLREQTFLPLKTLGTRMLNSLKATDASELLVKDAKTLNAKLQGKRIKTIVAPTDPNVPAPATISVSQQSYDMQTDNFSKIIDLYKSEPTYAPNETDLTIATLTTLLGNLRNANLKVITTFTDASNARISRNKILYNDTNGICATAQEVKNYIKSVYGASSAEYKMVSKIKLTTPKV